MPAMTPALAVPAHRVRARDLHRAVAAASRDDAFAPLDVPAALWPRFLELQGVDLLESFVAVRKGSIDAFVLASCRADTNRTRIALMGTRQEARRRGLAGMLLDEIAARARSQRREAVELQCFADNDAAVRLYGGRGFDVAYDMHTHVSLPPHAACAVPAADAVDMEAALEWLGAAVAGGLDLPFQSTPQGIRPASTPLVAWRAGGAQAIVTESSSGKAVVLSLVELDPAHSGSDAVVASLKLRWPHLPLHAPLQRAQPGDGVLARAGFARLPACQHMMRKSL